MDVAMDSAESGSTGWPIEDEFSVPELGATFSPFELKVPNGEDIVDHILSVINGPDQGVYVLLACGGISRLTVKRPGDATPFVYEGIVQILNLQGLYLPMEKGGPVTGRLRFLGGCIDKIPDKVTIEGEVCGELITACLGARVAVGTFHVDFEKLQRLGSSRILEAGPPILERVLVSPQCKPKTRRSYVRYVGGPPPPSPSERTDDVEIPRRKPRSYWRSLWLNCADPRRFLDYDLIPPYILRHPPPPPLPTMGERIEQLEEKIQRLEQGKVVMQEEIQPPPRMMERVEQLEEKIRRLEEDKVVMQQEIQQLKRQQDIDTGVSCNAATMNRLRFQN